MKMKRSADKGVPLVLIIRPDKTMDIAFPHRVRGNQVWYIDPRTRRQEVVILRPDALLHLGGAIVIPHVQGFLDALGWREMGSLLFTNDKFLAHLRQRMLELLELRKDKLKDKYDILKEKIENGSAIELADVWRQWRIKGIINNIPPPEPPAFLYAPEKLLSILEDLRTAVLAESMAYVKQITGLQGLLGGRMGWWLLLLLIGGGLLLLLLFGGAFHPAPAHPAPIKT